MKFPPVQLVELLVPVLLLEVGLPGRKGAGSTVKQGQNQHDIPVSGTCISEVADDGHVLSPTASAE